MSAAMDTTGLEEVVRMDNRPVRNKELQAVKMVLLQGMTLAQAGHHLGVSKQHVRNLLILGVKYGATGWKHPEDYIGFRYFGGMRYLRAEARRLFLSNTVENL